MVEVGDLGFESIIEGLSEKIAVFKVTQYQQIHHDAQDQPKCFIRFSFCLVNSEPNKIIYNG